MKLPRIVGAMSYIDDSLISESTKKKSKRKTVAWVAFAASFCIICVILTAFLSRSSQSEQETPSESDSVFWVDKRSKNDKNVSTSEGALVWPWSALEVHERFIELEFGNDVYTTRVSHSGMILSEDQLSDPLGNGTAKGYDIYEEKTHLTECEVFGIRGVQSNRFVAVKFNDGDGYYVFLNNKKTNAETLGELIESIDLSVNCPLTSFHRSSANEITKYSLSEHDSNALWQIIKEYSSTPLLTDAAHPWSRPIVSFSLTSEALGADNMSLSVDEGGYLKTNIENYGYEFFIGSEAVERIVEYAMSNKKNAPEEAKKQSLAGTVTEIGEDYIKVNDAVMMKDPADGIEFTVYANDNRIKRYIKSGLLSVGQTVVIEHYGIYKDSPTVIKTATVLHPAVISDSGSVEIPE